MAGTPTELHRLWMEAMNRGDLDGLVELYEPDATLPERGPAHPIASEGVGYHAPTTTPASPRAS